jgi:hypothetical protein
MVPRMGGERPDRIATAAEHVLKGEPHTQYQHSPVIDEKAGRYNVDCSAFVGLLLQKVAPEHLSLIPKSADERYPRAFEFFDFFQGPQAPGWKRIERLEEAKRGDLISWRTSDIRPRHDTGHVLVVARSPEFNTAAEAWDVAVHDSSPAAHFDDSRQRGGTYHPGIGSGVLRFRVDTKGVPIAFQFGPGSKFHGMAIAIARLENRSHAKETEASGAEQRTTLSEPPRGAGSSGHRIERAPVANEVLERDEFAFTTYALASTEGMLLLPMTIACWGPGQRIPQSIGNGAATYNLAGGVVFRNL